MALTAGQKARPSSFVGSASPLPLGVVARGNRTTSTASLAAETGVLRVSATVYAGRLYRIATTPLFLGGSAGATIAGILRYTTDGTNPTTSSTVLAAASGTPTSYTAQAVPVVGWFTPAANQTLKVLLTCARTGGTGNFNMSTSATYPSIDLVIEDCGVDPGDSGVDI